MQVERSPACRVCRCDIKSGDSAEEWTLT